MTRLPITHITFQPPVTVKGVGFSVPRATTDEKPRDNESRAKSITLLVEIAAIEITGDETKVFPMSRVVEWEWNGEETKAGPVPNRGADGASSGTAQAFRNHKSR